MKKKLFNIATAVLFALNSFFCIENITYVSATDETKLIALTFDDGPNTTTTNEVLDLLEQYDAKATFFLIGSNINDESAKSVKRAFDMGCEIANHSKTHSNMSSMSVEEIQAEVNYVDEKVFEITGEHTKFFRPPFIDTSQTMYDAIDMPFVCGIDCKDYMENVTAQQRADYILNNARDGIIVLLHDASGNNQTVEALEIVMPELIEQGYEFVTMTELFERQGETPDENLIYTCVAKYPCNGYSLNKTIFEGEATGDSSWSGWSETAVFDGAELKSLGDSYAIEVEYRGSNPPVIALQKWSGEAVWQTVQPFYSNGKKACFMAEDIISVLESINVDYTDLDRITLTASGGTMTVTNVSILQKNNSESESILGDVNGDLVFDITDIVIFKRYLLNDNAKLSNLKNADMNNDEILNIFDIIIMKNNMVK